MNALTIRKNCEFSLDEGSQDNIIWIDFDIIYRTVSELNKFRVFLTIKYSTVQNWYPGDKDGNDGLFNFVTTRGSCPLKQVPFQ